MGSVAPDILIQDQLLLRQEYDHVAPESHARKWFLEFNPNKNRGSNDFKDNQNDSLSADNR